MDDKRKIIIDCDAGTDDASAIIMALAHQNIEVIAITCVFGNTEVDNVVKNVLRVLKLCNRLDVSTTLLNMHMEYRKRNICNRSIKIILGCGNTTNRHTVIV